MGKPSVRIKRLRHCSARSSSWTASQPPMLARPSFLALIVIPSASEATSRAMSLTVRSDCPGSRSRMNHAFSAKRHASRNSGTPWRSHTARTPRRFSSDTGWPPPELFVMVMNTSGTSAPACLEQRVEAVEVHVPLERVVRARVESLRDHEVDGLGAGGLDVGPRRVEVGVVRHDLAGAGDHGEQDLLGGAALVGGDDVLEREQLLHGLEEPEPRRRAGVALVAPLHAGPLVARHGAGARVGEQVDEHVLGPQREQVVPAPRSAARRSSTVVIRSGSTEWIRNGSMIVSNAMPPIIAPNRVRRRSVAPDFGPRLRGVVPLGHWRRARRQSASARGGGR